MAKKAKKDSGVVSAQEKAQKKGEVIVLVSFLVGALAIIFGMGLISSFLSSNQADNRTIFLVGFGASAAVTVGLYLTGRRIAHKA
jgi:predicted permease